MRNEETMLELIVDTAQRDERIRAVIMNGSRANPNAPRDIFQDYDIVYLVIDVSVFRREPTWIQAFGELMIVQLPDDMLDPPPSNSGSFAYLMQFADGNRIDLTLYPLALLSTFEHDSMSIVLLDKDRIIPPLPPPSDHDYLPKPPTVKAYADCCNEFWWVSSTVAKALWRKELPFAKYLVDQIVRDQLMHMLIWQIGIQTQFAQNPGKYGKYVEHYLEPALWDMLQRTYADAEYDHTWDALETMCVLFRLAAMRVAAHFGYVYPQGDDERVSAHLSYVRVLPSDATAIY